MLFYYLLHYGHQCYIREKKLRCKIIRRILRILYASNIDLATEIGKGTRFSHYALGVTINANAIIGSNCQLEVNCVIGEDRQGRAPVIGNHVHVGAGAVILGGVSVGNYARIGANAVVVKDVPVGATVVGVPAKVVKIREVSKN